MTTYFVTAWCDRLFTAQCEVEAETPQEALAKARTAIDDAPAEECDGGYQWDEWRIDTAEADGVLLHLDDSLRVRSAAPKLLEALHAASAWIDAQLFEQRTEIQECIRQAITLAEGRAA
jgi:hypothetical protein